MDGTTDAGMEDRMKGRRKEEKGKRKEYVQRIRIILVDVRSRPVMSTVVTGIQGLHLHSKSHVSTTNNKK